MASRLLHAFTIAFFSKWLALLHVSEIFVADISQTPIHFDYMPCPVSMPSLASHIGPSHLLDRSHADQSLQVFDPSCPPGPGFWHRKSTKNTRFARLHVDDSKKAKQLKVAEPHLAEKWKNARCMLQILLFRWQFIYDLDLNSSCMKPGTQKCSKGLLEKNWFVQSWWFRGNSSAKWIHETSLVSRHEVPNIFWIIN